MLGRGTAPQRSQCDKGYQTRRPKGAKDAKEDRGWHQVTLGLAGRGGDASWKRGLRATVRGWVVISRTKSEGFQEEEEGVQARMRPGLSPGVEQRCSAVWLGLHQGPQPVLLALRETMGWGGVSVCPAQRRGGGAS